MSKQGDQDKGVFISHLFDEKSFYSYFRKDLLRAKNRVIIESPFISISRMEFLLPIFKKLVNRNVEIYIITKDPKSLLKIMANQSEKVITQLEMLGVHVFVASNNHHRKIAILDNRILWEGSLNILSHKNSREIMRRIEGEKYTKEMFNFLNLGKLIKKL